MERPRLPKLLRHLIRDRFLGVATVVLALVALAPLFFARVTPIVDISLHAGLAAQLPRLLAGEPLAQEHFMLQPHPAPYWLLYLLLWGFMSLLGPLGGVKVVAAIAGLATPLGVMRLAIALGRSPRLALWSFALFWEFNHSMGFFAYTLTIGLSLFFVAQVFEAVSKDRVSRGWVAKMAAFALLLANSHAHASGTATALLGMLALVELPNWRRFFTLVGLGSAPLLALLPWVVGMQIHDVGRERDPVSPTVGIWPTIAQRLSEIYKYTLDVVDHPVAHSLAGMALLVLLLGPLLLFRGSGFDRQTWRPLALYGAMWLLYLAMPIVMFEPFYSWFVSTRHATLIVLMGLLLPSQRFSGRKTWMLAPGLAATLVMSATVVWQFARFEKEVQPFYEIAKHVPPNSRVNWVLWQHGTPESTLRSLTGVAGYIVAQKGGYVPHLFQSPNLPVAYRDGAHLNFASWHDPFGFDPVAHSRGFDYVLVQGYDPRRLPAGQQAEFMENWHPDKMSVPYDALDFDAPPPLEVLARTDDFVVELVAHRGLWKLYQVRPLSREGRQDRAPRHGAPAGLR